MENLSDSEKKELRDKKRAEQEMNLKDLIKKSRDQKKTDPVVEFMFHPSNNSTPNDMVRAKITKFDPSEYIKVECGTENTAIFFIPRPILFRSGWIKRLFTENKVEYKEHQSQQIEFPEFDPTVFQLVFNWISKDYLLNGDEKQRIAFQFHLSDDLVMDVLNVAYFLEIPLLVESCINMLTEFLEYVPSLDNIPNELVHGIVKRLNTRRLLELEKREDFKKLSIDTAAYWKVKLEAKEWSLLEKVNEELSTKTMIKEYILGWDRITDQLETPIFLVPQAVDFKKAFLQRDLYDHSRKIGGTVDPDQFLQYLAQAGEFATFFKLNNLALFEQIDLVLNGLPNLTHLEIVGGEEASSLDLGEFTKKLSEYLVHHTKCSTLRITNWSTDPSLFVTLFECPSLTALDLSNNAMKGETSLLSGETTPEFDSLVYALSKNTSLKFLSFYGNPIGSHGASKILRAIEKHPCLHTLDLGNCSIMAKAVEWNLIENKKLQTLLLHENKLTTFFRGEPKLYNLAIQISTLNDFAQHIQNITNLDLSIAELGDEHITTILQSIIKFNVKLQVLCLSDNSFSIEGFKAIRDYLISPNCTLRSLDISRNLTGAKVGPTIAEGIAKNASLKSLNLSGIGIDDKNFEPIVQSLFNHPTIRFVHIHVNYISNVALENAMNLLPKIIFNTSSQIIEQDGTWYYRGNQLNKHYV